MDSKGHQNPVGATGDNSERLSEQHVLDHRGRWGWLVGYRALPSQRGWGKERALGRAPLLARIKYGIFTGKNL